MTAERDSAPGGAVPPLKRVRYYVAAEEVALVPDLHKSRTLCPWIDRYTGTAEALALSGIVPRELLPGQPGCARRSVSLRPAGAQKDEKGWGGTPGFLRVVRIAGDRYQADLTVSVAEQRRRYEEARAERQMEAIASKLQQEKERLLSIATGFIEAYSERPGFVGRFEAALLYSANGALPAWAARYEPKFQAFLAKLKTGSASRPAG